MHDINVNQLLGVTYSEFDNTVGPQLLYEYPKGAISLDDFEAVSEYVIVGKHLCEKIIMIKLGDIKFLNFSVAVENSKVFVIKFFLVLVTLKMYSFMCVNSMKGTLFHLPLGLSLKRIL